MTIAVLLGLNLVVLIGMGIYLNRRIDRRMKPDQLIEQLREEVNAVIGELNQATDRNVTIVEDRLDTLQKTIAKADRAAKALQREAERREESSRRYNDILKRGAGGTVVPAPNSKSTSGSGADSDASSPDIRPSSNPASNPPSKGTTPRDGADSGGTSDEERSHEPAGSKQLRPQNVNGQKEPERQSRPQSKKDRILDLHRKGIASNIIAGRVGSTIGEVELVISLAEGTE